MTMKVMYYSLIAFTGMLIVQPAQAMTRLKPASSLWQAFKNTSTGTKIALVGGIASLAIRIP